MKLLIDCADLNQIKEMDAIFALDGVTCNPTILRRANQQPYPALIAIREYIKDRDLHVQTISKDVDTIIKEANHITSKLGRHTFIKVPIDNVGMIAIRALKSAGFKVTATAVYDPMQAFLAAKAGADYVAPYVNRIDVINEQGIQTACLIHDILHKYELPCEVLGASFKRVDQVMGLLSHGVYSATLSYELLKHLLDNQHTQIAIDAFVADFEHLCGNNTTMLD